jgi:hypothetical protein
VSLKLKCLDVAALILGIYSIVRGIKFYRKKVVISHLSEGEEYVFIGTITFLIQVPFIGDNKPSWTYFLIGIIPIITFVIYMIVTRLNNVKYTVYTDKRKDLSEAIIYTLNKNHIDFTLVNNCIKMSKVPVSIAFIDNGFIIKNYKCLPEYKAFTLNLESNLKDIRIIKGKADWSLDFTCGVLLVLIVLYSLITTIFK